MPEIHARLQADPPARVADLACGGGISSIAIARGYPKVHVDGIDLDTASIELAAPASRRERRRGQGQLRGPRRGRSQRSARRYDLVTMFEALHDMSYPVDVLRAARGLLAEGGVVLVGDERTAESFGAPADDLERLYYGFSILHCLPVGMVGEGAVGTGTVMRPTTVEAYARAAGFADGRGGSDRERLLALLPPATVGRARATTGRTRRSRGRTSARAGRRRRAGAAAGTARTSASPSPSCSTSMIATHVSRPIRSASASGPIGCAKPSFAIVSIASASATPSISA